MMKNKLTILGVVIFFLSITIFISCNKEDNNRDGEIKAQKGTGLVDPIEFGKLHNKYLIEAINASKANRKLTSKQAFMSVKIENVSSEMQSKIFDTFSNTTSEQMKASILSHLKNPLAKDYFNQIDEALINATDFKKLSDKLDNIALSINQNLSGTDWDIIMVYLETVRSSSDVWFSKDMGGNGIGYAYRMGNNGSKDLTLKLLASLNASSDEGEMPSWVSKDGRGAGYGMVLWSFSAFLGPVGGAGLVYGAVSGAVTSSFLP